MLNPREPLWLPRHSVRSLLALVLVLSSIALAWAGRVDPKDVVTLAGIVVAFYFAGRGQVNGKE